MGRRTVFSIVLLFVALGLLTEIGLTAPLAAWTAVDTGIDYQEFTTSDPNNLFVARMDRSITSVTIESALGQGRINGGTEVVTGMAQRYDQAINYWDQSWGSRNRVAVAINGSFFDPNTGIIDGGQVHSGWYDKRFINFGPSGFSWNLNRSTFIGECVSHPSAKQFISYPATGNTQTFQGIGVPRGSDELILYTPQFDADTGTDNSGAEVLVELTRPALIMPSPSYVSGYVREVRDGQGSTPIPFGHVVLSATGTARSTLLANVSVGDEIRISQELRSLSEDCSTKLTYDWTKT